MHHRGTDKSKKAKRTFDMIISQSRSYLESNPKFALTRPPRPEIQEGQLTIVSMCLEPSGSNHSGEDLVPDCARRRYKATFKDPNADIRKSRLYHLNLLEPLGLITELL